VNTTLARRLGRLERALAPTVSGPVFVMAPDAGAAGREVERLAAEHGERLPRTLFVMVGPGAEGRAR
jgi:hypothetical protein